MTAQPTAKLPRRWYSPAYVALLDALADNAQQGRFPECHGSDAWLSEDAEVRAEAAARCAGCVVLAECEAAARELKPSFGVYGGRDHTKRAGGGDA